MRLWIFEKNEKFVLNYRLYTWAQYYRAHADQLDFLNYLKHNPQTNEGPQKSLWPRQTSIRRGESKSTVYIFVGNLFSHVSKNERPNMDHTKIDSTDLDSLRRELSHDCLGIFVALLVCQGIIFCACLADRQSSCTKDPKLRTKPLGEKNSTLPWPKLNYYFLGCFWKITSHIMIMELLVTAQLDAPRRKL